MAGNISRYITIMTLMLTAALAAGCATVGDQRADILYKSAANASGGSGDLHLVQDVAASSGGATPIQWIIGDVANGDGEKIGNVVTDIAPSDLIMNAFEQEFRGAGFDVIRDRTMPNDITRGLKLTSAVVKLTEVKSLTRSEAKCSMKVALELWRNGNAVSKLEYEAVFSDSAVVNRDELLPKVMLQTLQTLMKRAVPDLTALTGRK